MTTIILMGYRRKIAMSTTKPSRKELTHERIVESAARALRRHGYQGVGVADVMKDVGLTHGGFYAHFDSREAMLAEAVQQAGRESSATVRQSMNRRIAQGASPFRALVEAYLSDAHLNAVETGCPVAALASEIPRQQDALRDVSCERVSQLVKAVQQVLPADAAPEAGMVVASTLVGALQLARALGNNKKGKAMLAASCQALIVQYDQPARPAQREPAH